MSVLPSVSIRPHPSVSFQEIPEALVRFPGVDDRLPPVAPSPPESWLSHGTEIKHADGLFVKSNKLITKVGLALSKKLIARSS